MPLVSHKRFSHFNSSLESALSLWVRWHHHSGRSPWHSGRADIGEKHGLDNSVERICVGSVQVQHCFTGADLISVQLADPVALQYFDELLFSGPDIVLLIDP